MKIACLCCTYLRAHLLGHVIKSFLEQDYPRADRRLVILDDGGEYMKGHENWPMVMWGGDGWILYSVPTRYASLGEKRNALASYAMTDWPDCEAFAIWDDDDLYLPHALTATAWALERAPLSRPSQVLRLQSDNSFVRLKTGGLYHGGWAYRREIFERVGGYNPTWSNGEDQELLGRWREVGVETADPLERFDPFYCYRDYSASYHVSGCGPTGYEDLGRKAHDGVKSIDDLDISWPFDFHHARILPGRPGPRPF